MTVDVANSRHVDHGSLPRPPSVTENTPLLDSESARPLNSDDDSDSRSLPNGQPGQSLGWMRTTCIVLGMWTLIFLQGTPPDSTPT